MDFAGYYINLDRRPDRRAEIEAELARYNLLPAFQRFSAADGNALNVANPHLKTGEMGCFISHYLLLKAAQNSEHHLHIIEDDVVLAPCTEQAVRWALSQDVFAQYDIVYTDIWVPLLNDAYKAFKAFYDATVKRDAAGNIESVAFSIVDIRGQLFGSTSSYLVNKSCIRKLQDLYGREINHSPKQSIDLFVRKLNDEGKIRVGCLFPFVTSVRLEHIVETDITRPYHEMSALATHLARYAFFIGADHNLCRDYLQKYMPLPAANDRLAQMLTHLLSYSLTDNFKSF